MRTYRILPTLALAFVVALPASGRQDPARGDDQAKPKADGAPARVSAADAKAKLDELAKKPDEPPTEAEKQLDAAITRVKALKSVAADLRQSVDILNQTFEIQGRYLKGEGHRVRLDLKLKGPGNSDGQMLQVCDGKTLWDYTDNLAGKSCLKQQIDKILPKLNESDLTAEMKERYLTALGFAGPEALLTGLRNTVKFDRFEAGTVDVAVAGGKPESRPVWVLRGDWKDRKNLTPPDQAPMPATGPLPPYVPAQADLTIDQERGWPYKVVFRGKPRSDLYDTRPLGPDGKPIGKKKKNTDERPTLIVLNYSNVRLGPALEDKDFAFTPPDPKIVEDLTDQRLAELERFAADQASRKADGATKADPTTPEIPVGKLPGETHKDEATKPDSVRSTAPPK